MRARIQPWAWGKHIPVFMLMLCVVFALQLCLLKTTNGTSMQPQCLFFRGRDNFSLEGRYYTLITRYWNDRRSEGKKRKEKAGSAKGVKEREGIRKGRGGQA